MGLTGYNLRRNRTGQGSVSSPSGTTEKKAEVKVEKKTTGTAGTPKVDKKAKVEKPAEEPAEEKKETGDNLF